MIYKTSTPLQAHSDSNRMYIDLHNELVKGISQMWRQHRLRL